MTAPISPILNLSKESKSKILYGKKKVKSFPLSFWLMSLLVGCAVFTIIRTSQIHFDDVTTTTTPELIEPIENLASSTLQGGAKDPKQAEGDKSPYRPSLIGLPDFEPCRSLQEVNAANIDEELLFWWDGQPKLCQLIRKLKGGVNHIEDPGSPAVLNLNINCTNLTHNNGLGPGNWLVGFYMARLAAAFTSVHLKFECSAANYKTEVLPFLQGCYLPVTDRYPPVKDRWPQENATEHLLCGWDMMTAPIQLAALEIRDAMRHLVLSATGFERPPLSVPVNTTMFGQVSFDEVAIHFRCGDVIKMTNPRGDYGFTRYSEYKKRISPDAKSIGIITQSFDKSRLRDQDQEHTEVCRDLVHLLVGRMRKDYPRATVSIRNGPSETLPLAYSRLAVAEQSIIGLSSFSAFPILANYGTSYFEEGRFLVNKWLNFVPELMGNVEPIKNGEFLRNRRIMKKGINFTKDWILG